MVHFLDPGLEDSLVIHRPAFLAEQALDHAQAPADVHRNVKWASLHSGHPT
jgi:hypothetical protein